MTDPQGNRTGVTGGEAAGLGVQFAGILVAFTFLGLWIDRHLETSPWFLIVMVFGGAAAGFYSMYRKLMKGGRSGGAKANPNTQTARRRGAAPPGPPPPPFSPPGEPIHWVRRGHHRHH